MNNRFRVRSILFWSLAFRFVTYMIIFLFTPSFAVLSVVAISWGILEAIFWLAGLAALTLLVLREPHVHVRTIPD